jgi:hypothetical protein
LSESAEQRKVGVFKEDVLKAFLLTMGTLAACAPAEHPMVMITPEISACDVKALSEFVGAGRAVLSGVVFTVPVRWIEPGGMITMDYSAERINFELDANSVITRAYCG